mmetsp:Transcript_46646/g.101762  ORF Transcript_46646/g.101762 Transcript_46646/m.101762 type:complete len:492 (-) Transcript_46646:39-1514(-)
MAAGQWQCVVKKKRPKKGQRSGEWKKTAPGAPMPAVPPTERSTGDVTEEVREPSSTVLEASCEASTEIVTVSPEAASKAEDSPQARPMNAEDVPLTPSPILCPAAFGREDGPPPSEVLDLGFEAYPDCGMMFWQPVVFDAGAGMFNNAQVMSMASVPFSRFDTELLYDLSSHAFTGPCATASDCGERGERSDEEICSAVLEALLDCPKEVRKGRKWAEWTGSPDLWFPDSAKGFSCEASGAISELGEGQHKELQGQDDEATTVSGTLEEGAAASEKGSLTTAWETGSGASEGMLTEMPESLYDNHGMSEWTWDAVDTRTTVMLRNIPNKYSRDMLVDRLNEDMKGHFDFLYLPIDFKNKCNVGYGFINFRSIESRDRFIQLYSGAYVQDVLPRFRSMKSLEVTWARVNGLEENVRRLRNSQVMCELVDNPEWMPVIFDEYGERLPFPQPHEDEQFRSGKRPPLRTTKGRPTPEGPRMSGRPSGFRSKHPAH